MTSRSEKWKSIWVKKGLIEGVPLHQADGFDSLSQDEWDDMVYQVTQNLGLKDGSSILDCGCGAGAFLLSLTKHYRDLDLVGVDYSESLLKMAMKKLVGKFYCSDIQYLSFLKDQSFDFALSFSTFHYLPSELSAEKVIREMVRVTKKKGTVYIGEVSDLTKELDARIIREKTHASQKKLSAEELDHLFLSKEFFYKLAEQMSLVINIKDHTSFNLGDYGAAKYRYSVYLNKTE